MATKPSTPDPISAADQPAPVSADAAPLPVRIEPTESVPEPLPATGGKWVRQADGGLAPADESTARAAGLRWPA